MDTTNEEYYELNEAQQAAIETGRAQIKNGKFKPNEEVMRGLREMLSTKNDFDVI